MKQELESAPLTFTNLKYHNDELISKIALVAKSEERNHFIIAARGSSRLASGVFKFYLETKTPFIVSFAEMSISNFYKARPDYSKAVFIAVSQSGMSADTFNILKNAKECGALTVAITNNPNSNAAECADFHLDLLQGEEKAVAATKTFTAEAAVLLHFALKLSGCDYDFLKLRDLCVKALSTPLPEPSNELLKSKGVICLSRGSSEAVAKECGLKLMECCYKFTYSSSVNEFKHGPRALIEKGQSVIIFAPAFEMFEDFKSSAEELKELGAHLTIFSDSDELLSLADTPIKMPETDFYSAPIVYAVKMQQFVEKTAIKLGINPDQPRNLKKITLTK